MDEMQINIILEQQKKIVFQFCYKFELDEEIAIEFFSKLLRIEKEFLNLENDILFYKSTLANELFECSLNHDIFTICCCLGEFSFNEKQLFSFCKIIKIFLNENYCKGDLNFKMIDPMYFEKILGIDIPFLLSARLEKININDLKCFSLDDKNGIELTKGRYYKQIISGHYINYPNHENNLINQTNEQRTKKALNAMMNNSYGLTGEYIIVYNDSNIIRDGEHRASALKFIYDDINIYVLRLKFSKNYYSYKLFYKNGK